jgi:hypothetical protein
MELYIFIGMFQGINDRIEPYLNEADAKKAWSDYTETPYSDFEKDNRILDGTRYEGSTVYGADFPMKCYDPKRQIAIIWDIDDVKIERPDLTDEQAMEVLERVKDKHDAEMGVSWTTLGEWAGILFPPASNQSDNDKLIETAVRLYQANANVSADYSVHDALYEASEIHGVTDLHNGEDDERYGEYQDLVCEVEKHLGIAV